MEISPAGIKLLKSFEGFRSFTYLDSVGLRTIGWGHKLLPSEIFPRGITLQGADIFLERDLKIAESAVARFVHVPLTQGQFDALVSFTFNLGAGRLEKSTLLKKLNEKDYKAAAEQFLIWDHAGTVVVPALLARRVAEKNVFTS